MKIYIIGYGNMGRAIVRALVKNNLPAKIFINDRKAVKPLKEATADKNFDYLASADFVILAVKPQDLSGLAPRVEGRLNPKSFLISIAAGVKIAKIQKLFNHKKVVRMMPNLGLGVGQGIAGWKAAGLSAKEKSRIIKLLNRISENFEVKGENQLDAITSISGSGPAYFFYLAAALEKSAKSLGFDGKTSRQLVEKTFSAAAILQKNQPYDTLIRQVASKKGTTEAALQVFKKSGLDRIIHQAAVAAQRRARELSHG